MIPCGSGSKEEAMTIEEAWAALRAEVETDVDSHAPLKHAAAQIERGYTIGVTMDAARALALAVLDEAMEIYSGYDPEFKVDETAASDYLVARARIEALGA